MPHVRRPSYDGPGAVNKAIMVPTDSMPNPEIIEPGFCLFCSSQNNDFFSLRVPEFPLKLNCHASITKRDSFRRLDQVLRDSDCLADHHLSGFDNRRRDVRLALGGVNRLTGRFTEICSAFKSSSRTISNSHSHN